MQGLWSWVLVQTRIATEAPDGDTSTWSLADWGGLSEFPGDARVFLAALVDAGLVVELAGGGRWVPLAWADEQPHLIHARARSAAATKAAQTRWNRFLQPELALDASRTQAALPVPNRSEPNRSDTQGLTAGAAPLALPPAGASSTPPVFFSTAWPDRVRDVGTKLAAMHRELLAHDRPELDPVSRARLENTRAGLEQFDDADYWSAIDEWLGGDDSAVFYLDEFRAFWAWHVARPVSQRRRALKQAFRNWLAKSERWKENDAQRKAIREREQPGRHRR